MSLEHCVVPKRKAVLKKKLKKKKHCIGVCVRIQLKDGSIAKAGTI